MRHRLFGEGSRVIAAVSGGSDSTFMLWALRQLASKLGIELSALHINHMLRGLESDGDEEFVRHTCEAWGIPLTVHRVDVAQRAKEWRLGVEEAARRVRESVFAEAARKSGGVVALAHTANDVVETFMFNLLRGTGVRGLTSLQPRRRHIVRPVLHLWRHEIRNALRRLGISWREDSSNLDNRYTRNRIRNVLLPYIEKHFGGESIGHIYRASRLLLDTRRALEGCFRERYARALVAACEGLIMFRARETLSDPFSFGEMLAQALPQLGVGLRDFSFERAERVFYALAEAPRGKRFPIYGGVFAVRCGEYVLLAHRIPIQLRQAELEPDGELVLDGDLGKLSVMLTEPPKQPKMRNKLVAHISYRGERISIRPYSGAMLFRPLGGASVRLASFLKKRGVPQIFRKALPLIFLDRRLAWVGGVEISEDFKITDATTSALRIEWSGEFPKMVAAATGGED